MQSVRPSAESRSRPIRCASSAELSSLPRSSSAQSSEGGFSAFESSASASLSMEAAFSSTISSSAERCSRAAYSAAPAAVNSLSRPTETSRIFRP